MNLTIVFTAFSDTSLKRRAFTILDTFQRHCFVVFVQL